MLEVSLDMTEAFPLILRSKHSLEVLVIDIGGTVVPPKSSVSWL